jgi:hypothetical protein
MRSVASGAFSKPPGVPSGSKTLLIAALSEPPGVPPGSKTL